MNFSKFHVLILCLPLFWACQKEFDQKGCTDPIAVNYEPRALHEDGSCAYNQAVQTIWNNGERGGWNNNLTEGAFRLEVCEGTADEVLHTVDSLSEYRTLSLSTAGAERHLSWFSLINETDARDFTEGTLRFECRTVEGGSPEFIKLFISGKLPGQQSCTDYRRSTYVEISTHSFNDSTFTTVSIPIRHFEQIMMARVNVVCGFDFEGDRNSAVEVDNIRWSANRIPDPEPEAEPEPEEDPAEEEVDDTGEEDSNDDGGDGSDETEGNG
ncbi:MAG: hypothetical protein ABR572_07270 [Cryomorphaceae bacterium]